MNITGNTMEDGVWGVTLGRNAAYVQNVSNNTMNNVFDNIDFKDQPASGTVVRANVITTSALYSQAYNYGGLGNPTGITLSNFTNTNTATLLIDTNTISIPAFDGRLLHCMPSLLKNIITSFFKFQNNMINIAHPKFLFVYKGDGRVYV